MNQVHFPRSIKLFVSLVLLGLIIGLFFDFRFPDEHAFVTLSSLNTSISNSFFTTVNYWPEPISIALVALFYLFLKPYRFLVLLINLALIMPITFGLKSLIEKSRPVQELGAELALLLTRDMSSFSADNMSFPSGHSTSAFALAVFCLYEPRINHRGVAVGLFLLAASAAISRVYLGHHYLTDILAGSFLGTVLAVIITGYTEQHMSERLKNWRWKFFDFS